MPRKKGNSQGSIYYNKQRENWLVQRYELDYETGKNKKITKTFYTKEEAQKYLDSVMYQQSNPLYIKNNGIPLTQLMKANAKKKLDTNLISENQYGRILKTINVIEKSVIANKKIDELSSEEIQKYLNNVVIFDMGTILAQHFSITKSNDKLEVKVFFTYDNENIKNKVNKILNFSITTEQIDL